MESLQQRITRRLQLLYGEQRGEQTAARLMRRLTRVPRQDPPLSDPMKRRLPFDERDVVLITYGDSLRDDSEPPLSVLHAFACSRLRGLISTIHILPFFPYSSDDGFSVIDFHAVDPQLGSWADVEALSRDFRLAFDFVLNHISSKSAWFQGYLAGDGPLRELAIAVDPDSDLSSVVRPRSLPLLTEYRRADGSTLQLWTTFSADQIDLNYGDPDVLLAMVDVLLCYVEHGASMLRLDAIGFLYKEIGTSCMHLPRTHEVVRLLRDLLDMVAPQVALLTETNVPHAENISYFGDGHDEAQLVYNFSLPPLVLHALSSGSATDLARWAGTLASPSDATTFFNFTASHDGIGVRPLEGLLPAEAIESLAELARRRGGRVSCRTGPDGAQTPYELNVTYLDALRGEGQGGDAHVERFLASQAIALCLPGVPAIYVGSLLGSSNWQEGVRRSGAPRAINRQKLALEQVEAELADPGSLRARIFDGLCRLIRARISQPAFHPGAALELLELHPRCLSVMRRTQGQSLLALTSVADRPLDLMLPGEMAGCSDLLGAASPRGGRFSLAPYQVAWLTR